MNELLVSSRVRFQAGVIAHRASSAGTEILLVTRRSGTGWTIPKGCRESGRQAPDTARSEALEEGGVDGTLLPFAVGRFDYRKFGATCRVEVFSMEVKQVYPSWSEDKVRVRGWFSIEGASRLVDNPELARLFRAIDHQLRD